MRALLDVNVLIALLDAGHVHHATASVWLYANVEKGWASCPLTQNGCLRILRLKHIHDANRWLQSQRAAGGHADALP